MIEIEGEAGSRHFYHNMYEAYKANPEGSLEYLFRKSEKDRAWDRGKIFVWVTSLGTHKLHRYGRYRYITRDELKGRKYEIEFLDHQIGIYFTDVLYDPKTYSHIPLESYDPEADRKDSF